MGAKLYVGNLSDSTTSEELSVLFTQAGNVMAVEMIKGLHSDGSRGFAFVTMSEQNDANKAISMFNTYSLNGHDLNVNMAIVK